MTKPLHHIVTTGCLAMVLCTTSLAQDRHVVDSLKALVQAFCSVSRPDTACIKALNDLAWQLRYSAPDSSLILGEKALNLCDRLPVIQNLKYRINDLKSTSLGNQGVYYKIRGDYPRAHEYCLKALKINEAMLSESNNKFEKEMALQGICSRYGNIGNVYASQGDYEKALDHYEKALSIANDLADNKRIAAWLNNIANVYSYQGDYSKALGNYLQALKIDEVLGDGRAIGGDLGRIGVIYHRQADYPKALDYYLRALTIAEELGNKDYIAAWLNNIGLLYSNQHDYETALTYYWKALKLHEELKSASEIASDLGNIAIICADQGHYARALQYYFRAVQIDEELGDLKGLSRQFGNIGIVYKEQGDSAFNTSGEGRVMALEDKYPKALSYYFKALKMDEELGDQDGIARHLGNIGLVFIKTGKLIEAEDYIKKAVAISDSIGALNELRQFEEAFSQLYEVTGHFKDALLHAKITRALTDSLFNNMKSEEIGKLEGKHEFDVAEMERKRTDEAEATRLAELKARRNNLQYSGILIFLVMVFSGIFSLGRISIPVRLAEGMIFFAFLLLFEFTLVLLDHYLEQYSGGEPAFKLLFNAVLAGAIFPVHHFFEEKLKQKLVKGT